MSANALSIDESPARGAPSERSAHAPVQQVAIPQSVLIAQTLILAFLFAIPAIRAFYHPCVIDPDIWWHVSIGDWIAQHHAVPHVDFMSRSVAGTPWQAYSWLFDLLASTLFRNFGLVGILSYTAAMLLAIAFAIYRLASRRLDFSLSVALTFAVGFSIIPLETPRSWLFTILFFLLELDIVMRARESGKLRDLIWVPVILALWANLHIQFVHGLILLAIAFGEAVASRWWRDKEVKTSPLTLAATLLASVAATLCNPYGWHIYRVAYDFGTQSQALNKISEVQAMTFRDPTNFTVLLLTFAAVVVLARQSRPLLFEKALFVFAALISFHSLRDIWMVAVLSCAVLGTFGFTRNPQQPAQLSASALALATVLAVVTCTVSARAFHLNNQQLSQMQRTALPVGAADFVATHHLQGPLYNDFTWGGYLYWRLHLPVSIDGRVAPYGAARIDRSVATWAGAPDWANDTLLQSANVVIGPVNFPLTQLLRADPRFHLVYEDKLAAVFTR